MIVRWRKLLKRYIPGIISGGADNDPSGISTYSICGAQFGYQLLWLLILSTPMLIAVQAMSARLGDVKKKGLMTIIREHYSPVISIAASVILVLTNTATLGADLAAVADAFGIITHSAFILWVIPVAAVLWYLVVFKNYRNIEKYLFVLSFIFFAYVASGFLARPNWRDVLMAIVVPKITFSPRFFIMALGLLGTTITPFLFFWQAKQEVEEHTSGAELMQRAKKEDIIISPGFIYSNIISLFIIISTASVLYVHGNGEIASAQDAALGLVPIAGKFAGTLFAIGIIGSGLMAVPVLAASSAYVIAEAFGWRDSLSDTVNQAKGFYAVLTGSIVIGIGIAMSGVNPIQALLYSQVFSGMLAPFLIILILLLCNDKKIMGNYMNGWFDNIFGGLAAVVMILGSTGFFWHLLGFG